MTPELVHPNAYGEDRFRNGGGQIHLRFTCDGCGTEAVIKAPSVSEAHERLEDDQGWVLNIVLGQRRVTVADLCPRCRKLDYGCGYK